MRTTGLIQTLRIGGDTVAMSTIQLSERARASVAECPASEAQNRKTTEPRCKPITLHLKWCLHCHRRCFQTRSVPILVFTSLVIFLMCDLLQHGELVQALLVVIFDSCSLLMCIYARGTHRLFLHRIFTSGPNGRLFLHRLCATSMILFAAVHLRSRNCFCIVFSKYFSLLDR